MGEGELSHFFTAAMNDRPLMVVGVWVTRDYRLGKPVLALEITERPPPSPSSIYPPNTHFSRISNADL